MTLDDGGREDSATRFLKALGVAAGILALSCLLLFVPVVGWLLLITAAPFLACHYGVALSGLDTERGWLWLGLSAGAIITVLESSILLSLVGIMGAVEPLEPVGLMLLGAILVSNLAFGALGARRAAAELAR